MQIEIRRRLIREKYRAGYFKIDWIVRRASNGYSYHFWHKDTKICVGSIGDEHGARVIQFVPKSSKFRDKRPRTIIYSPKDYELKKWFTVLSKDFDSVEEAKSFLQDWYLEFCAVFYKGKIEC